MLLQLCEQGRHGCSLVLVDVDVGVVAVLLFSDDENHPRHIGCIDPACDVLLVTEGLYC